MPWIDDPPVVRWQCNMCHRSVDFTITKHDSVIYYNCASCGYSVDRLDLELNE